MNAPQTTERAKPLDFGRDGITGSVDATGRLIALNSYHPVHGYVGLTTADPFPETERYNAAAVRAYRRGLPLLRGAGYDGAISGGDWQMDGLVAVQSVTITNDAKATIHTWACDDGACQMIDLPLSAGPALWSGRVSLQRAAYTQLTEGGPVPNPPVRTVAHLGNGVLTLTNPALGAAVAICGFDRDASYEATADGPLDLQLPLAAHDGQIDLVYTFGATAHDAKIRATALHEIGVEKLFEREARYRKALEGATHDALLHRALAYGLTVATPIDEESTCLLTDHMLLPLSWNRDAYFVARALLGWRQNAIHAHEIVRRHLVWMFETAERANGAWGRSYLANGRIKDAAFQLDQQVWPLLELAEYIEITGDQTTARRFRPDADGVLAMLFSVKARHALLFPTDETPADDPLTLPYHLSSHILIWRAASKLAALGFGGGWAEIARDLPDTIRQFFVTERDTARLYAYATDGHGQFRLYHDANDFPLALAPAWGFVPADDPVWQATTSFAWSDANTGGCYGGRLGSVHTPGAWPLGDVQEMIVARALSDSQRQARALERLRAAAFGDGALPEAVDPQTNAAISRTWFAWPNAAYACFVLGAFSAWNRMR